MVKAERYTKKVLSEIEVSRLRAICVETENGVLGIEQGFDNPEKCEMLHDIVDSMCHEAKRSKKRER